MEASRNNARTFTTTAALCALVVFAPAGADEPQDPPETIEITGIVRDFKEWGAPGGHPDFEKMPDKGFGRYAGHIATIPGDDGKPVFTGNGAKPDWIKVKTLQGSKAGGIWNDSFHKD